MARQPIAARARTNSRARRNLVVGRINRPASAPDKNLVEDARHLAGFAIFDVIDAHTRPCRVGLIQTRDPGLDGFQHFRPSSNDQDGIHPTDDKNLDDVLRESSVARIKDLFEIRLNSFRCAVLNWEDADRLPLHPIRIETENGIDRSSALWTAALNDQQVPADVSTHRTGLGGKGLHQFQQVLRGTIT